MVAGAVVANNTLVLLVGATVVDALSIAGAALVIAAAVALAAITTAGLIDETETAIGIGLTLLQGGAVAAQLVGDAAVLIGAAGIGADTLVGLTGLAVGTGVASDSGIAGGDLAALDTRDLA